LREEPVSGSVSLDLTESAVDWFDLKVVLNVGDTTLTPAELKLLLNGARGYVRLGKKGWRRLQFKLTPEEDEQLARIGLNPRIFPRNRSVSMRCNWLMRPRKNSSRPNTSRKFNAASAN